MTMNNQYEGSSATSAAQNNSFNVKAQYNNEIRRFGIAAFSVALVEERLRALFAVPENAPLDLFYRDADNDLVTMTSDEELQHAVQLSNGLLRLEVRLKGAPNVPQAPNPSAPALEPEEMFGHWGRHGMGMHGFKRGHSWGDQDHFAKRHHGGPPGFFGEGEGFFGGRGGFQGRGGPFGGRGGHFDGMGGFEGGRGGFEGRGGPFGGRGAFEGRGGGFGGRGGRGGHFEGRGGHFEGRGGHFGHFGGRGGHVGPFGGEQPAQFFEGSEGKLEKLTARHVKDVTIPDGTRIAPRTPFVKTWKVRNEGLPWPSGTRLLFISTKGDQMGAPEFVPVEGQVLSGSEVDISVSLVAPEEPGFYTGFWRLADANGKKFGQRLWCSINVTSSSSSDDSSPEASYASEIDAVGKKLEELGLDVPKNRKVERLLHKFGGDVNLVVAVITAKASKGLRKHHDKHHEKHHHGCRKY